jgi:hypothetical protein
MKYYLNDGIKEVKNGAWKRHRRKERKYKSFSRKTCEKEVSAKT